MSPPELSKPPWRSASRGRNPFLSSSWRADFLTVSPAPHRSAVSVTSPALPCRGPTAYISLKESNQSGGGTSYSASLYPPHAPTSVRSDINCQTDCTQSGQTQLSSSTKLKNSYLASKTPRRRACANPSRDSWTTRRRVAASCGHSSWASLAVPSEDALSTKTTSHGKRPSHLWPTRWASVAGKRLALL